MFIDILFVLCICIAAWKGFRKGFVVALFSVLAFIVGLAAALKLSTMVAGWLSGSGTLAGPWLPVISFVLVFIGVVLLIRMGAALIEKTLEIALLGWANRLAGMALYLLLYLMMLSVLLFYASQTHFIAPETLAASKTWPWIEPVAPKVIDALGSVLPFLKNMFEELKTFFGGLSKNKA